MSTCKCKKCRNLSIKLTKVHLSVQFCFSFEGHFAHSERTHLRELMGDGRVCEEAEWLMYHCLLVKTVYFLGICLIIFLD